MAQRKTVISRFVALAIICALILPNAAWAAGPEIVDLDTLSRIRQEGFRHSQVMLTLSELTDRIGPRLTGSRQLKAANNWTRDKLSEWGLTNAHLESWEFGRGWEEQFTSVRMITPANAMLRAIPRAWTPGTNGPVRGKVIQLPIDSKDDLAQYKGKVEGMIVLLGRMRDVNAATDPLATRYTSERLQEIAQYQIPDGRPGPYGGSEEIRKRLDLAKAVNQFLREEKALAVIEPSRFDQGLVTISGTDGYKSSQPTGLPTLNMSIEHFGRISRLLERNVPVELELNVQTKFFDDDPMAYNTIAEIPGTDKKDEVVMLGGHLDSWHGGTGATDNAAGVAACMEAVRILQTLGIKPRRTIRIALWSGEEQGLYGSRAYVKQHFAARPEPTDPKEKELPEYLRRSTGPLAFKPEYGKVAAYFNIDNGTGKLRGIYAQENSAVQPIFESWIQPLKDLGVTTVSMRNTSGTDHLSFAQVGLPGFQFIQDPIEYMTRTHHTDIDVYERIQREDLMQQAVVMAWFVYNAAMRDQQLPHPPLAREEARK